MATQIGPKIGIEGEKEYRSQIQQIIQQTKNLDAAMNKTTSEWTQNTSAMTKNRAIAQNLTQQITLQRQKLATMNAMLEQATQKYGETDAKTQAWQRTIDTTTASLNRMEQELKQLGNAANFSDLQTKFADLGTRVQNMGQSIASVGTRMTAAITLPLVAAGAAAVKLASDTEEARSKTEVVFGSMAEQVKQFASTALNSYGLAEGSALQMVSTFGAMATSMGLSQQVAASMSMELTSLAADMASFYNVSTEVAQTSLQGVFTGETEALKKFGIVMTQTNLEEFAAKQGKVYSKMSEGEKVMTRYQFVLEATRDAQGDFQRTSDGTANTLRVFVESCKELGASLGEAILPIITPIIQRITTFVQLLANMPGPVKTVVVAIGMLVAVIGPLLIIIGSLMSAFGSIITNAPLVAAAFIKIAEGAATMMGAIAAAAPEILLIVAALAAVAVVAYEVATHWDEISAAAASLGEKIASAYNAIMAKNDELRDSVNQFIIDVIEYFRQLPQKLAQAIKDAADRVKNQFDAMIKKAKQSGKDFIEGFVAGIRDKIQKVVDTVKEVADTIKDYLGFSRPDKGPLHVYEEWMPHFMQGLAQGIKSNIGLIRGAVNDVAKTIELPLSSSASMNMALSGASGEAVSLPMGGTTMNIYVDHISELSDLIRIQNQAQQRYRMGAR